MSEVDSALARYRQTCGDFRLDVPERFNFGRDVVDRFARDPERPALWWRNAAGRERRLRFDDVRRASNRVARRVAWIPRHSVDPWSTVMKIEA